MQTGHRMGDGTRGMDARHMTDAINARLDRPRWLPVVLAFACAGLVLVIGIDSSATAAALCGAVAVSLAARLFDVYRHVTRLQFGSSDYVPEYQAALGAVTELAHSKAVWHILAERDAQGRERNAGVTALVRREIASVGELKPPYIESNVPVQGIAHKDFGVYLLPNHILLYRDKQYTSLAYSSLRASAKLISRIESIAPSDSTIIDTTWEHARKDGGPDRRFSHNRQLSVVQYSELHVTSSAGWAMTFQVSNVSAADRACEMLSRLAPPSHRAEARDQHQSSAGQHSEHERAQQHQSREGGSNKAGDKGDKNDELTSAYATLQLSPGASSGQVRDAFHALAKQYHPDRVPSDLGPEFKQLADRKMKDLLAAYKLIKANEPISHANDNDGGENANEDELLAEAARVVREYRRASISLLQRRFSIGYSRAARLLDQLEERGVVRRSEDGYSRVVSEAWDDNSD